MVGSREAIGIIHVQCSGSSSIIIVLGGYLYELELNLKKKIFRCSCTKFEVAFHLNVVCELKVTDDSYPLVFMRRVI